MQCKATRHEKAWLHAGAACQDLLDAVVPLGLMWPCPHLNSIGVAGIPLFVYMFYASVMSCNPGNCQTSKLDATYSLMCKHGCSCIVEHVS